MIQFMLCFSRQGRVRLERWYSADFESLDASLANAFRYCFPPLFLRGDRQLLKSDIVKRILARKRGDCCFLEWQGFKAIYKRYASLIFCSVIDHDDNELVALEQIHKYVELLDRYFGSVCELDIIFKFDKALSIWDELFMAGEMQESSGMEVLEAMRRMDLKMAECRGNKQI